MIDGKSITPKNQFQIEVAHRFTDIQLCREFGWTPSDIAEMPVSFYQDAVLVLSKENAKNSRHSSLTK